MDDTSTVVGQKSVDTPGHTNTCGFLSHQKPTKKPKIQIKTKDRHIQLAYNYANPMIYRMNAKTHCGHLEVDAVVITDTSRNLI